MTLQLKHVLYNSRNMDCNSAEEKASPVFHKSHLICQLQPATKTCARKLAYYIFVLNPMPNGCSVKYITLGRKENKFLLKKHQNHHSVETQSLKTRLPRHLLGCIDICYQILKSSKDKSIVGRLNAHCSLPNFTDVKDVPRLLQLHSTSHEVFLFLRLVLVSVLPKNTWGSKDNSTCFLHGLRRVLKMRKFDHMDISSVVEGMDLKNIPWLRGKNKDGVFQKFIKWLVNEYIFTLLKRFFYITESATKRNRLYYYRKEVWQHVIRTVIEQNKCTHSWRSISLQSSSNGCFQELKVPHHFDSSRMLLSSIRLLPKSQNVRMLMRTQGVRCHIDSLSFSAKFSDKRLLEILTKLWKEHPDIAGSSGFGINFIREKWRKFLSSSESLNMKAHYFVAVDIKQCFDSIPHEKLYEVLEKVCCRRKNVKPGVIETIRDKINQTVLEIAGQYFIKLHGIPQGWSLAAMLCNLFYAQYEREIFPELLVEDFSAGCSSSDHRRVLLRVLDDFLLVTTDMDQAIRFLR